MLFKVACTIKKVRDHRLCNDQQFPVGYQVVLHFNVPLCTNDRNYCL